MRERRKRATVRIKGKKSKKKETKQSGSTTTGPTRGQQTTAIPDELSTPASAQPASRSTASESTATITSPAPPPPQRRQHRPRPQHRPPHHQRAGATSSRRRQSAGAGMAHVLSGLKPENQVQFKIFSSSTLLVSAPTRHIRAACTCEGTGWHAGTCTRVPVVTRTAPWQNGLYTLSPSPRVRSVGANSGTNSWHVILRRCRYNSHNSYDIFTGRH